MPGIYELDEKDWPLARRWKATDKARGRYMGDMCLAMYEKWGEEGLEVIGKVYASAAERTFLKGLKDFGIKGNGADAMAKFFVIANSVLSYPMEMVEASEKKAVIRYHSCHLFAKPSPGAEQICRRAIFSYEQKAAALLNPKLKVYFTKVWTGGDPYCEWVAESEDSTNR